MSYLNPLRLHFAGQFQANISTVNNDPAHFDNASFESSYQQMQGSSGPPNGWFNPSGDANFRLLGCTVTSAWTDAGQVLAGSDPVLGCIVADSDESVSAKLVDLDPEQQLVSEIWGLQVRIADAQGNTLLRSRFEPAGFIDIWNRATSSAGGDTGAGAAYQSVLTDLEWGDVSGSTLLTDLRKAAAASGMLSIKFNVDGLSMDFASPQFMCGRIAGTIGPAAVGEPNHLIVGRQFMAVMEETGSFPVPAGGINFFPAVVDTDAGAVYLDLGNALSTVEDGGPMNDVGDLTLSVYDPLLSPENPAGSTIPIGTIPAAEYAQDPGWYARTAGVVAVPLPAPPPLRLGSAPLILTGNSGIAISEAPSGAFLRADRFVYRMSPGDSVQIPVYAMQWGAPLAGAAVTWTLDPSQLQPAPTPNQPPYLSTGPAVGTPADALAFPSGAITDEAGVATLDVTASDPGTPRWVNGKYGIDGQVYGIRPAFSDPDLADGPVNQWNFVSLLVWSGFTAANPPTWTDVQPVFQQYGNLYPVMLRFLDLTSYESVTATANIALLQLAFGLDPSDPNAMPVTRDLSPAKRAAILAWLANPLPGAAAPLEAAKGAAPAAPPPAEGAEISAQGGKAAAVARRLVVQNR